MPRIGEIFSEGLEHVRRSFRRFNFKQRLKTAERMKRRTLQAIGETVWRLQLEEGRGCDAWKELESIEREIALIHKETVRKTDQLREHLVEERDKQISLEKSGGTADVDLEELASKRSAQQSEIDKFEQALKNAKDDEARLASAKDDLINARAALKEIDARIEAIQESIENTADSQHTFLKTAEQTEKKEQAILSEMKKKEEALKTSCSPHFRALGRHLLNNRPDQSDLSPLYSRYDLVAATEQATRNNIENERRLLKMLDQPSVVWFYGIVIGSSFVVAAILILLLLWLIPALW